MKRSELGALLQAAGLTPDNNVCASCGHAGGDHDLGNWCLVCPRPPYLSTGNGSFTARSEAGWDFFTSQTEEETWARATKLVWDGLADMRSASVAAHRFLNMTRCECGAMWPEGFVHEGCTVTHDET